MYAIVTTGGKQYKVAKGDVIDVEKLDAQPGDVVKLDVLLLSDGKKLTTDASELASLKVSCKVVEQFKGKKELVFKFKKRKRYSRLKGHRQNLTRLEVSSLPAKKKASVKSAEKASKSEEKDSAQAAE